MIGEECTRGTEERSETLFWESGVGRREAGSIVLPAAPSDGWLTDW